MPDVLPATRTYVSKADFDPAFIKLAESESTDQDFHLGDEW